MRYVIVGAGAIGGGIAYRLAQHSVEHPPLLIARGDNARAIIRGGLRFRSPDDDASIPVAIASTPGEVTLRPDDVLVFATKTHQVHAALLEWVDQAVTDAGGRVIGNAGELLPVFMALNGVESERMAARLFRHVFGMCVWMPAVHLAPGDFAVRIGPISGMFIVGRYNGTPRDGDENLLSTLRNDWEDSTFRIHVVDDVMRWKRAKLIANLGNAVQALVGAGVDTGDVVDILRAEGRAVLERARLETASEQEEAALRGDVFSIRPIPGLTGELGGSSWQSLVRGSGSIETDYLNGEIVMLARLNGMDAPANEAVQNAARTAAARQLQPGSMSVDDLRALIR
ncbi:MAG TPA: 2-dehydropantoate 2-reductase N-terminal domain-containing protein [Microbacteriaceae bacterium]|nr:2-dehydropantoate 2-reductase N-terminal domain-containing protein [Microbacteriaceae bacterium]